MQLPEETVQVAGFQRRLCQQHAAVFVIDMHGAQNGAVARSSTNFREPRIKVFLIYLAQHLLSEERADFGEFRRNGGIVCRQVGVVGAAVDDYQRVPVILKVHGNAFRPGLLPGRKIQEHYPAGSRGRLIQQAAGFAEKPVFGELADAGDFQRGQPCAGQMVLDGAQQHLKRRRG